MRYGRIPRSRRRGITPRALLVCMVERTRWPVVAAVIAVPAVSVSLISPISMTSGSCLKKYFIADAGYNSKKNINYLIQKGNIPIIWNNKRNTKNKETIEKNKIKGNKLKKYKRRHIAENFFSWIDNKIPRLARIYDKNINNYINMTYIAIIDIAIGNCAFK